MGVHMNSQCRDCRCAALIYVSFVQSPGANAG